MNKTTLKFLLTLLIGATLVLSTYFFVGEKQPQVLGISTNSNLKIEFFDVGQGDVSMITVPDGEQILIDGGPDKLVINKLSASLPLGDRKIEYVILSHGHADHVSGLVEVLKRYEVGRVIMTDAMHTAPDFLEFLKLIKEKNIPVTLIDQPQKLIIASTTFDFLRPTESFLLDRPENLNNTSIVFKLIYGSSTALFMGDYENEESLVASSSVNLKSDLIKIGHHGSTNANDQKFLQAVAPLYVVIPVGLKNQFGHPHYRTIHYLEELGVQIFRTDERGDVTFVSDGIIIQPLTK